MVLLRSWSRAVYSAHIWSGMRERALKFELRESPCEDSAAVAWIDRSADASALQSSLRVLSWPMSTTLMECIKLSTGDIDRTASLQAAWKRIYKIKCFSSPQWGRGGDTRAKHAAQGSVSTRPQVFRTQPYIIMQICDSDMLFFFLALRHFDEGLYRWLIR